MSEPIIRLTAFVSIFALMAAYELWSPRLERNEMTGALKSRRWVTNVSMVVLSSICLRIIFPVAAVGTAIYASANGYGLLPALGVSPVMAGIISFIILDFAVWLEHVASHKIPLLWRIHRMHHSDQGFDLTTALRFHPLEIVLSMVWKAAVILALGAPAAAVLVFEIVLNGMAMFNHANANIPRHIDNAMRKIVVTPDMHRVHHSAIMRETDSNYGFNFSIWDRLFKTYIAQPDAGHDRMTIGLEDFKGPGTSNLWWTLLLPFRSKEAASGLARHQSDVPKGSSGK